SNNCTSVNVLPGATEKLEWSVPPVSQVDTDNNIRGNSNENLRVLAKDNYGNATEDAPTVTLKFYNTYDAGTSTCTTEYTANPSYPTTGNSLSLSSGQIEFPAFRFKKAGVNKYLEAATSTGKKICYSTPITIAPGSPK